MRENSICWGTKWQIACKSLWILGEFAVRDRKILIGIRASIPSHLTRVLTVFRVLQDKDWRARESAILALGAISEGCAQGLLPYLADMIQMLLPKLDDPRPLVRGITCWALSRYSQWVAQASRQGIQLAQGQSVAILEVITFASECNTSLAISNKCSGGDVNAYIWIHLCYSSRQEQNHFIDTWIWQQLTYTGAHLALGTAVVCGTQRSMFKGRESLLFC